MTTSADGSKEVFINCPYDLEYACILDAICFAVQACGFIPRCAQEFTDSSNARMENIFGLIERCQLAVHDLSRVELSPTNELPRFNMPFELGVFMGAKRFGDEHHRRKSCVILESNEHRYQSFLSDIAGYDIQIHHGDFAHAIACVRHYLRGAVAAPSEFVMPSSTELTLRYSQYLQELAYISNRLKEEPSKLHFLDRRQLIYVWLREEQSRASSRN